ncbi:MAG: hypothetical protein Q8867_01860 [Bacteroidota bacterium]|nr:hypothetical protein [Bacteroidota bacterium]
MKISLPFLWLGMVLLLSSFPLKAQNNFFNNNGLPLKSLESPAFGQDILIHDMPDRNQHNVKVCSAFNGWLYAAYSYIDSYFGDISLCLLKSTNNGISWEVLGEGGTGETFSFATKIELLVCGNNLSNLKIFLGYAFQDTIMGMVGAHLSRYNAEPFEYEAALFPDQYTCDISIASDYLFPTNNSNPFSLAMLFSKEGSHGHDSLIFRYSNDGGVTFPVRNIVAISNQFVHKVALDYGRSPSESNGRYFAAWEEQNNLNAPYGHIYTAHSSSNPVNPFSTHICLDSLDPSTLNKVRNPVIACQQSDADNDSLNLSEVVMFEKSLPVSPYHNLKGYYNLQAAKSNHFRNFIAVPASHYVIQPDISFNPFSSNFMLTYFDSTTQKLPYFTKNVNLPDPNTWTQMTSGYNDNGNMTSPHPSIRLKYDDQEAMFSWSGTRPNNNGVALYDATNSTYNGIPETNMQENVRFYGASPNPCHTNTTIRFDLFNPEHVTISLFNDLGKSEGIIADQIFPVGNNKVNIDVSKLSPGVDYYSFKAGMYSSSGKIVVY